eukprot:g9076.t1
MEQEETNTLLDNPSIIQTIPKEVIPRSDYFHRGRSSVPLRATRRASLAILAIHLVLLVVNTFSWNQLAACAICIFMSTKVLLCTSSKDTHTHAGFVYAVGCVLDVGQFIRWLRMAFIVHQNNLARHPADQVPVVMLVLVIVPIAFGAGCCAYGSVSAFDAVCGWSHHHHQPPDHGVSGLAMLPVYDDRAG